MIGAVRITVLGSVNLDLVATAATLPAPGETVVGARLARHPGGKGANQALAARRIGAEVALLARIGDDAFADESTALLRAEGVDLSACTVDPTEPTGAALIAVSASGENQIVVASGANMAFNPDQLGPPIEDALICQLELPLETVARAVEAATGFICVNLAPAQAVPDVILSRPDLLVVNEGEAAFYGEALSQAAGLVAVTWGARGAGIYRAGVLLASAAPPKVSPVDTTGAGDSFVAALVVALQEGQAPAQALAFACAAGALTTTRPGAQPSLPRREEVEALLAASAV